MSAYQSFITIICYIILSLANLCYLSMHLKSVAKIIFCLMNIALLTCMYAIATGEIISKMFQGIYVFFLVLYTIAIGIVLTNIPQMVSKLLGIYLIFSSLSILYMSTLKATSSLEKNIYNFYISFFIFIFIYIAYFLLVKVTTNTISSRVIVLVIGYIIGVVFIVSYFSLFEVMENSIINLLYTTLYNCMNLSEPTNNEQLNIIHLVQFIVFNILNVTILADLIHIAYDYMKSKK